MYYTGIGSRKINKETYDLMFAIGKHMAEQGHFLYSGGADGSDTAFEYGHRSVQPVDNFKIFLPWKGFGMSRDGVMDFKLDIFNYQTLGPRQLIYAHNILIESEVCPNLGEYPESFQDLFKRSVLQITGPNPNIERHDPLRSRLVIYSSPVNHGGEVMGGTRIAVNLAKHLTIPTYNLSVPKERTEVLSLIDFDQDHSF